jgi:hypothetical protein
MDARRTLLNIRVRKSRHRLAIDVDAICSFIEALKSLIDSDGDHSTCDFIPIRLVTMLEILVRDWIALLVDTGEPFEDAAQKLVKTVRFDYLLSKALHTQEITLGDVAADAVSVNTLGSIISTFDALLGQSTWDLIATAVTEEGAPIVSDVETLKQVVGQVFEVRHIVVHEWPSIAPYSVSDLGSFIDCVNVFVQALDAGLSKKIWWNDTSRIADLTGAQHASVATSTIELERFYAQLLTRFPSAVERVHLAHDCWKEFVLADVQMHKAVHPSDVSELLSLIHHEAVTEWRVEELRSLLRNLEDVQTCLSP